MVYCLPGDESPGYYRSSLRDNFRAASRVEFSYQPKSPVVAASPRCDLLCKVLSQFQRSNAAAVTRENSRRRPQRTQRSEFVKGDLAWWDAKCSEHFTAGFDHHRGTAKVVFDCLWIFVISEIIVEHDFVHKAGEPGPSVLR
jgi:hypothetical protein